MRRSGWGPPEKDPHKRAPRWRPTSTLWHNLGDASEWAAARHRGCLGPPPPAAGEDKRQRPRLPAKRTQRPPRATAASPSGPASATPPSTSCSPTATAPAVIAAELGLARNTVRRFARARDPEQLLVHDKYRARPSVLEEYAPYLHQRCNADARTPPASGGRSVPAATPAATPASVTTSPRSAAPRTAPARSPRRRRPGKVTSWSLTRPGDLASGEQAVRSRPSSPGPERPAPRARPGICPPDYRAPRT